MISGAIAFEGSSTDTLHTAVADIGDKRDTVSCQQSEFCEKSMLRHTA